MSGELFGRYRIEDLLGRGGMGEVHRAFDLERRRLVALKRLNVAVAGDPEFRHRFRREAESVSRLTDGHVIPIHDFGEIEGRLFIDMRLVEGADLASALSWSGRLPVERTVRIVSQIARALDAAHVAGLVHRDVKPSNILLAGATPEPEPWYEDYAYLVDFGIVHHAASTRLTSTGTAIGTAEYMAPERFTAGASDRRGDVYALGCVLVQMLTGAVPFAGGDVFAQMWAHVNSPAPRVSVRCPELGTAFDDVVAAALAKDPADRIATAGGLAAAARHVLEHTGGAISGRSSTVLRHPGRDRSRHGPASRTVLTGTAAVTPDGRQLAPDTVIPDVGERFPPVAPVTVVTGSHMISTGHGESRRGAGRRHRVWEAVALVGAVAFTLVVLILATLREPTPNSPRASDGVTGEGVTAAAVTEPLLRHLPADVVGSCGEVSQGWPQSVRCAEWTYTQANSGGDAIRQIRGREADNGYCGDLRYGARMDQWRANGRGTAVHCSLDGETYRIVGATDMVAVVVSAATEDVEHFEGLLAEVQTVLAQLQN